MQTTEDLFFQPVVERNRWLIRLRWVYPFFIFFLTLIFRGPVTGMSISYPRIFLLLLFPLLGNFFCSLVFRRLGKKLAAPADYRRLILFASVQLDFDLLVVFFNTYFSGGIDSPLVNLFFLNIILTPFLVENRKGIRNLLTAIVLLTVSLVGKYSGFDIPSLPLTRLLIMILLFLFTFIIASFLSKNMQKNEEVLQKLLIRTHELSISDGLTSLYNQTYFFDILESESRKSLRHGFSFSLIMFDVDFFKNYNDHNGHMRGSGALKRIGEIMKRIFRTSDVLAKYGGDEFVVILPQTDKVGAYLAAERFREAIESEPFPGAELQPQRKLTVSIGIASFPEHSQNKDEIVEKVDKALYMAKELGKNRTVIYHESLEEEVT